MTTALDPQIGTGYHVRLLPREEWARLEVTEASGVWRDLDPAHTQVVIVEQDGALVGSWLVLRVVHVECVWIAPSHRHAPGVVRRLVSGMRAAARRWGARAVVTAAVSEDVRTLIGKLGGTRQPGETFVIPLEAPCPPSS